MRVIKDESLKRLKELIEGEDRGNSLDPSLIWVKDPRSVMGPPRKIRNYSPLSYVEDLLEDQKFDLFTSYD